MDEHVLALVKQYTGHAGKGRIVCINRYPRKIGTATEHIYPDVCDAVWNCDAIQAHAIKERAISDAGDRQAIDRTGDGYITTGTSVSGYIDRAVIGRAGIWHPYCSRTTAKRRSPSRGIGQVIDSYKVVIIKYSRIKTGCVTLEIDRR